MAQSRYGVLTDVELKRRIHACGTLISDESSGEASWDGVIGAAGLDGAPNVLRSGLIRDAIRSGTFIFNKSDPVSVILPVINSGRHYRFIVTVPPVGGSHVINLNAVDQGRLNGGLSVPRAVPSGVFADNDSSISFTDKCSIGDRIELFCDRHGWYIMDGLARNNGAVVFA